MIQKCLTLTQLTHQSRQSRQKGMNDRRELIITLTILAGMLVPYLLFANDNEISRELALGFDVHAYTSHLTLSFIRSFLMLIFCFFAVLATDSKRLAYGLTTFLTLSMGMDLLSLLSHDIYYTLKPYRYTNYYNFKDVYFTFEVLCVLYTFINFTFNYVKSRFSDNIGRLNVVRSTTIDKNISARK